MKLFVKHNISINPIEICFGCICRWTTESEVKEFIKMFRMPPGVVSGYSSKVCLEKDLVGEISRLSRLTTIPPQSILDDAVRIWQFVFLLDIFRSENDNQNKLIDADKLWKRFNYTSRWNDFLIKPGYVSLASVTDLNRLFDNFSQFVEEERLRYACRNYRWEVLNGQVDHLADP